MAESLFTNSRRKQNRFYYKTFQKTIVFLILNLLVAWVQGEKRLVFGGRETIQRYSKGRFYLNEYGTLHYVSVSSNFQGLQNWTERIKQQKF